MDKPSVKRAGRYTDNSHERYVCTGRGITAHGPTAKSAWTWWWVAQNPWPKGRSGSRKKLFTMTEEAYGGIDGYEMRPQRDGRVYMPIAKV